MRASGGALAASLVVLLSVSVLYVPAVAKTGHSNGHRGMNPAKQIAAAQKAVGRLPASSFARGQRAKVLGALGQSASALERKRTCKAIVALDLAHSLLLSGRTWRHGPPKVVRQAIAPSLNRAERSLAHGASSCAAVSSTFSHPRSTRVGGAPSTPVPSHTSINSQGADEDETQIPSGPFIPLTNKGPAVTLRPSPQFLGEGSGSAGSGGARSPFGFGFPGSARARPADASDFHIGRSTNLGVPPAGGEPKEMTTAIGHNVVWYTGNTAAGYSLDGGKTWSALVNPNTILTPDPPNLPICCDQQVVYSQSQNLFVWIVQYYCPVAQIPDPDKSKPPGSTIASNDCGSVPGNNVIRFAVATPEEIRRAAAAGNVGKAWHIVMDLTPQQLGEPANAWFDYSTVSVNDWSVNWTVDIFEGSHSAVAMRINLQSLAGHSFQANYIFSGQHTVAAQEPPGQTRSFFVVENTFSQLRVWDWNGSSTVPIAHDINHPTTPTYDFAIPGSDGNDWNARATNFVGQAFTAAWAQNQLIVGDMNGRSECTAKCASSSPTLHQVFKHPGVTFTKVDTTDWSRDDLFGELWSVDNAISWPALGVAKDGELGLSFLASPENANPVAWAGFLTLRGDQFVNQVSDPAAGPQPGIQIPGTTTFSGGTGDYYSLQPGPELDSFVMPFRSVDPTPGGSSDDWHFVSYGHTPLYPPTPPFVRITSPTQGATFTQGTRIGFNAVVSDSLDVQIPYDAIYWSIDGKVTALHGSPVFIADLGFGDHTVTVTAVNSSGLSASNSIKVTINPPTPGAPTVSIDSPLDGAGFQATDGDAQGDFVDVPIQAEASDPQGKALVYSWDDTVTEADGTTYSRFGISHDLSPTLRLYVHETNCGAARHELVLNVFNGSQAATATVHVTVTSQLCVR